MIKHRINCAEIEVKVREAALAEEVIARISELRERRIAPLFDRVFSEVSGPGRLDRIELLELELGTIPVEEFEDELLRKLEAALRAALLQRLSGAGAVETSVRASLELIEVFALTGNVPWWADRAEPELIGSHVRAAAAADPRGLAVLVRAIAADPAAVARIAPQLAEVIRGRAELRVFFPAELVARIEQVASPEAPIDSKASKPPSERQPIELIKALERIESIESIEVIEPVEPAGVVEAIEASHPREERRAPEVAEAPDPPRVDPPRETREVTEAPAPIHDDLSERPEPREPSRTDPARRAEPTRTPPRPARANEAARRRVLAGLDQLYTSDGGLVLLWPFLDRFFHRAGLLDDHHRFQDEPARMQAIALLSYLATEDPSPLEFRLPLAKLLAGLTPEAPYALDRPLAPEQLEECDHLLAAAIAHAPILGDLAPAAFRATFLARDAALTTRDGGWFLQVERETHDVLLDRFPWSWTWVKLPWMSDPLRVEW